MQITSSPIRKAALVGWVRTPAEIAEGRLRQGDRRAPAIRVNTVAPGWIETELTRGLVQDVTRSAGIVARTPAGRWGQPGDVAGAVVFLCSDAARFVNGVNPSGRRRLCGHVKGSGR